MVTQGNHAKVPSFATRLEGTLNQIRLQCPWRMMDLEVQQHLKDCLFHGVHKHIRDSIRYLYSTPRTSYSQLMVATQKAESENDEIQNKVRARAAVTTDSGVIGATDCQTDGCPDQCRAAAQPVPQTAPEREAMRRGWTNRGTSSCTSSHNCQTGLGQTVPDHSTPTGFGTGTTISRNQGQGSQGTNTRCECTVNRRDNNSLQCFRCQGWGHMAQEWPIPDAAINQSGGN